MSTLLILAVEDGKLPNIDATVASLGWDFAGKEKGMTFRHLANMVSGCGLDEAVQQTGNATWREARERGFDFVLRSQSSNGGFPQRFPNPTSFHAHITFHDGVMIGITNFLLDDHERKEHFAWLDDDTTTLEPRSARTFELVSICPQETTEIVRVPDASVCSQSRDSAVDRVGSEVAKESFVG